jgi:hypothetical protein
MKRTILLTIAIFIAAGLWAEGWNTSADVSMNLNQNSYSDNWAGEEIGAISWAFNANLLAEKQLTDKVNNKNTLKLAFGQTHSQYVAVDSTKKWAKPDKTTDLIDFETMFRFTLGLVVDPFASVRLESQFMDKRENEVKNFNPNILTETFGVARMFIKEENKELSARFGAAFKQYFDEYADESTNDGGIEFVSIYTKPFRENMIKYSTNLNLYKPFFYSESDDALNDDWKQVRMNWQHDVDISLTSLINLKLYVQLLYNEMVIDEVQFKETLGLGFSYKLF